jgi:iron complex outermembrane receptor protein
MKARRDTSIPPLFPRPAGIRFGIGVATVLLLSTALLPPRPVQGEVAPQSIERPRSLKKLSLDQLFDLEVTTVSQKPESLSKTAAAIHVVTQNDLQQMGALSLPEALRDIPGVEVARVDSRQNANSARGVNGTVANKLLVLIGGRSVNTPLYSGVFWDVQDTFMEDIEQIEVIRGPGATVWGSNAVNGVINVRTKDAAETQGWLVDGGGGSAERGFGGARYGGTLGRSATFRIYGKHFERDASLRPDGSEAGDDWRMSQGGFRVDWDPRSADRLTFQGDAYDGSVDQPNAEATDLSGGNGLARWTRRLSATADLELRGYYDRTDRQIPGIFGETLDTYDLAFRHRFSSGQSQDVVWGIEYRLLRDDVRNSPGLAFLPDRIAHQLFSGFVQDELALMRDRLRLTLGSKVEHNDYTGFEFQPSVRLAWLPVTSQTAWAAASRAVRTPSRIDRDLFAPATPPFFLAGGPNFDSEVLRAFELGYKVTATSALTGSISTFYNLYDHLRSLELGLPLVLANGIKAHTYGAEAEASLQVSSPWRLSAGYSYLKMKVEAESWSTDQTSYLQSGDSPQHQAFLRSSLQMPHGVALDLTSRYVGNLPHQQVPAYATGDARLSWQATNKVELDLVGQNLFDPRHPEFGMPASRREIPRGAYGKVTCRF